MKEFMKEDTLYSTAKQDIADIIKNNNSVLYRAVTQQRLFYGSLIPLKKEIWNNLVRFQNETAYSHIKTNSAKPGLILKLKELLQLRPQSLLKPVAATFAALAVVSSAILLNQKEQHSLAGTVTVSNASQARSAMQQWAFPQAEKNILTKTSEDFHGEVAHSDKYNFITIHQGKFFFSGSEKLAKPLAIVSGEHAVVITGTTLSVSYDAKTMTTNWQLLEGKIEVYRSQKQNGKIVFTEKKQFDFPHAVQLDRQQRTPAIEQKNLSVDATLWAMFSQVNGENSSKVYELRLSLQSQNIETPVLSKEEKRESITVAKNLKLEMAPAKPMFRFTTTDGRVIVAELLTQNETEYQVLLNDKKATLQKSEITQTEEL